MGMYDLYTQRCREPSDMYEHLPVHVETCLQLDAKKVIELGVCAGVSTVGWLYGLELTDGHLWSVDINSPKNMPRVDGERWTFIQGDDLDPEVIAQLPDPVDVVFIDTLHYYEHTLNELAAYLPRVRSGGRIVLHDTELDRSYFPPDQREHEFPVKDAVTEFCAARGLAWTNRTNCFGLGTICVP